MTQTGLIGLLVIFGFTLLGVGMMARVGRLRRNGLVGIRTPAVMASPLAWRVGHRAGGP